jgi:hypothetical protein
MALHRTLAAAAVLLALAACNSGPPSEATERMRAERECRDKPFPEHTPIFRYCVDQEMAKYRRSAEAKKLYDSTIRNIPTTTTTTP